MRFATAGVFVRISRSSTVLVPIRQSLCADTQRRTEEIIRRTSLCSSAGNTCTMRPTASRARPLWSVPKTRCPVSAAVSAAAMVSLSRISPTAMTSGSSRRDSRTPSAKLTASRPISRWRTRDFPAERTYSTGSSKVTM